MKIEGRGVKWREYLKLPFVRIDANDDDPLVTKYHVALRVDFVLAVALVAAILFLITR